MPLKFHVGLHMLRYTIILMFILPAGYASTNQERTLPCGKSTVEFTVEHARQLEAHGWSRAQEILARISAPVFPTNTMYLTDFAGKGDKITDNRPAFQQAIQSLSGKGGGKLIVSPGEYLVDGPIVLKSNIHIELQKGATVIFSSKAESYLPAVKQRWEGTVCYNYSPLLYAAGQTNLALTGEGTIDGNGAQWSKDWRKEQKKDQARVRQMGNDKVPEARRVFGNGFLDLDGDNKDDGHGDGRKHFLRPPLIQFYECENFLLEGLTIKNSPFWTVHPVFCRNVIGRNLTIRGTTLNDDGFDPDSCEDVLIEGCDIVTKDDAISIKAGRDQDAWDRPGSTNLIIRNNRLSSGANALGIGSEMSGGVKNVFMENNTLIDSQNALCFKCNLDRGGEIENIYVRNTKICNCRETMLTFTMDYHSYRGNHFPAKFHNFFVSGVTCDPSVGRTFTIVGVPDQPIERVYLNDVTVKQAMNGNTIKYVAHMLVSNVLIGGVPVQRDAQNNPSASNGI